MAANQQVPAPAVTLRYKASKGSVAKMAGNGRGLPAETILALAKQHNVPIRQDKNLLQILSGLDLNQKFPPDVYRAVAEILAFVYRLSKTEPER